MNKTKKTKIILVAIFLLILNANAARVGVVVTFPDGTTTTKCVNTVEDENGYNVINGAGISAAWSSDPLWGHGLCGINSIGCPSDNCWCAYPDYWGFFVREADSRSWKYSAVGFDSGSSCSEHYCAKNGDMVGLAYGPYGTKPKKVSYDDVCPPIKRARRIFVVGMATNTLAVGDKIKINVSQNGTTNMIKGAEVELFAGTPGMSRTLFSGKTDANGEIEIPLDILGLLNLRINVHKYSPSQQIISLDVKTPATPEAIEITTTIISPAVTTTIPSEEKTQPLVLGKATSPLSNKFSFEGNIVLDLLLVLLLGWFLHFKKSKKK